MVEGKAARPDALRGLRGCERRGVLFEGGAFTRPPWPRRDGRSAA
jgi:hypothetical protein